jgi:hypothetical protein
LIKLSKLEFLLKFFTKLFHYAIKIFRLRKLNRYRKKQQNIIAKQLLETLPDLPESVKTGVKTSVSFALKLSFVLAVFFAIILFYLVTIVSNQPQSIPFVEKKIKEQLNVKFSNKVNFDKSYLSFTSYGMLKIGFENFTFSEGLSGANNSSSARFRRIDLEMPLWRAVLGEFVPNNIWLNDGEAVISLDKDIDNVSYKNKIEFNDATIHKFLLGFVPDVQNLPAIKINIGNFKLTFASYFPKNIKQDDLLPAPYLSSSDADNKEENLGNFVSQSLLLKTFKIDAKNIDNKFNLGATGIVLVADLPEELKLRIACEVNKNGSGDCKALIEKLDLAKITSKIAYIDAIKQNIKEIDASFDLYFHLKMANFRLNKFDFNILSKLAKVNVLSFFAAPILLEDLKISGDFLFAEKKFRILALDGYLVNAKEQNLTETTSSANNLTNGIINKDSKPDSKADSRAHSKSFRFIADVFNDVFEKKTSNHSDNKEKSQNQHSNHNTRSARISLSTNILFDKEAIEKKLDLEILLRDFNLSQVIEMWPIALGEANINIRNWFIASFKELAVKNAKLNLTMQFGLENSLESLIAKVDFVKGKLNYHLDFLPVDNIEGLANFSTKAMLINIKSATVGDSKITASTAKIDFNDKAQNLEISLYGNGKVADIFAHLPFLKIAKNLSQQIIGNYQAKVDLLIPITKMAKFTDFKIVANAFLSNLSGNYLGNNATIKLNKGIGSDKISAFADLVDSHIKIEHLGFTSVAGKSGQLMLDAIFLEGGGSDLDLYYWLGGKRLLYQNGFNSIEVANVLEAPIPLLSKKDLPQALNLRLATSSGGAFDLKTLSLDNKISQKNQYRLNYRVAKSGKLFDHDTSYLDIKGSKLDFSSLESVIAKNSDSKKNNRLIADINIGKIYLERDKILSDVKLKTDCQTPVSCRSINVKFNNGEKPDSKSFAAIDFKTKKVSQDHNLITGNIINLGELSDILNLSKTIGGGDLDFRGETFVFNDSIQLKTEIKLEKELTIYNNSEIKKIAKDSIIDNIKDKIFANNKIILSSGKILLASENSILKIESLAASNYKIGLTAKGFYNLQDRSFDFKGMVVPVFVINNLFGIGKVPIIGKVIKTVVTGEEGGGLFSIRYQYKRDKNQEEASFSTSKSSFLPSSLSQIFE